MITQDFRPQKWSEIKGQKLAKSIMRSVVENSDKAPRSYVISGAWGTGKTTIARVFARSLNCLNYNGEPCGKCINCQTDINYASFYNEYDSSMIGVQNIRDLRDSFLMVQKGQKKVIVFDESHAISAVAQSALLKVVEEAPKNVFFLFVTTELDKVLSTIRSRSLEVPLFLLDNETIKESLIDVSNKMGIVVPDDILDLIVVRSKGHLRDAHMLLDLYIISEESFKNNGSIKTLIKKMIYASIKNDLDIYYKTVNDIFSYPLSYIKDDFYIAINEIMSSYVDSSKGSKIDKAISEKIPFQKFLSLFKIINSDWFINSFQSDTQLQSSFLYLFKILSNI